MVLSAVSAECAFCSVRWKLSRTGNNVLIIFSFSYAIASDICACCNIKKPGFAFCYGCLTALPDNLKLSLYRPLRDGFEEAYEEAVEWLNENLW
jgi:hypothetical protein